MENRGVSLLVGKRSYSFLTSLDEDRLSEVYDVLRDVVATTDSALHQDERLFISCMVLASELVSTSSRLEHILNSGQKEQKTEQ